ncbi:MFS transporter [Escherichia coli]
MYYLKNTNFLDVRFILFLFTFLSWEPLFPFFPIWLHDINHISKSDTGIIFAAISTVLCYYSNRCLVYFSDKLGLRKYLLWIITGMLVMFAPFFYFYLWATVTIQHFSWIDCWWYLSWLLF